jgi:hypothetical protein
VPQCRNCGHQLADGAQVCDRCNAPVAAGPPPAPGAYGAPPPSYATPPPPLPPPPASPWAGGPAPYAPPSYPAPGYGYAAPGYPPPPGNRTNGLAIGSLVSSLVGLVTCGLGSIVGVVLGHMAIGQIKRSGEEGRGLAVAGLAVGYVIIALGIAYWVLIIALSASD